MFKIYDFSISLMIVGMKILTLFNKKIKKGVEGRKESLKKVKANLSPKDKVIWMHAASLGEYEQGLPVLELLRNKYPMYRVLITFFSPSGYEHINKKNKSEDIICYLPFDKKSNIENFISQFDPVIFFTIKYDYWYRLLEVLNKKRIPIYVISALFYEKQVFFKTKGHFFVNQLKKDISLFFHQTKHSCQLATSIGLTNSILSGDTRYDRVKENVKNFSSIPFISDFINNQKTIVVGSSWQAEEAIVELFIAHDRNIKIIIAPHDLKRIPEIKKRFGNHCILYSELKNNDKADYNKQILIIDNIGMLSRLYRYASVALIGGGFHKAGLHNILEAAAYDIPVFFGNQYRKNPEADDLINANAAKSFSTEKETADFLLKIISDSSLCQKMSRNAKDFIQSQPNSAKIIIDNIHLIE